MGVSVHGKVKCPKCSATYDIRLEEYRSQHESQEETRPVTSVNPDDIGALLGVIDEDTLNDLARKFVAETKERFEQYGAKTRMSEKQMAWLRKLAASEF